MLKYHLPPSPSSMAATHPYIPICPFLHIINAYRASRSTAYAPTRNPILSRTTTKELLDILDGTPCFLTTLDLNHRADQIMVNSVSHD